MSRKDDDDSAGIEVPLELRGAFENAAELARLRRNAFESVGQPYAAGILYGMGLAQGLLGKRAESLDFGREMPREFNDSWQRGEYPPECQQYARI